MKVTPKMLRIFLEECYDGEVIKEGNEWIIPSFLNPHKMKTYINLDKGLAYDFIDSRGYNGLQLIHELMGHETFEDTQKWIKQDFLFKRLSHFDKEDLIDEGQQVKKTKLPPPPVQRIPMPAGVVPIDRSHNAGYDHFRVKQYCHSRHLANKDIVRYHLMCGTKAPTEEGERDYRNRLIIPFIENGEIVWFQARAIGDNKPRYLNPKGIASNMLVYNIDNQDDVAIIVEGPIDAMMVDGQAIMGNTISDWQVAKILAKKPSQVVVVPDSDEQVLPGGEKISVGYRGALKSIERFVQAGFPVSNIHIALVEGGKDLNDIGQKRAVETIYAAQPLTLKLLLQFSKKGAESDLLKKLV